MIELGQNIIKKIKQDRQKLWLEAEFSLIYFWLKLFFWSKGFIQFCMFAVARELGCLKYKLNALWTSWDWKRLSDYIWNL